MIELTLGIIIGLIFAVLVLVVLMYFKTPLERTINRTLSITRKKGEILEPENEDIENWEESLKTNTIYADHQTKNSG